MLEIYYGRENINKSKFVFQNIEKKSFVIVPDQFTLQCERDAFIYTKKKALMDIEIISFSRLASTIIEKTGGDVLTISKEGRQMLISKILRDNKEELSVFKKSYDKSDFVTLVNDLISEIKQSNTTYDEIRKAANELETDGILKRKLIEIALIYEAYQNSIEGKYTDTEDYISLFIEKIYEFEELKNYNIVLYGFESFTEKNLQIIRTLEKVCKSIKIILTHDDKEKSSLFNTATNVISRLERNSDIRFEKISDEFIESQSEDIAHIEKNLYSLDLDIKKSIGDIKLVKASNPYSEACSAAEYILKLVREEGYRYKDIAIISNDIENRAALYTMVFKQYGIDLFIDSKREVFYHPVISFITSLLDIVQKGFQREDIIKYIKTGYAIGEEYDIEAFEIYVSKYNIKGNKWKEDFEKGTTEYQKEKLDTFNSIRKKVILPILAFINDFKLASNTEEKVKSLYRFLQEDMNIEEKLKETVKKQENAGNLEIAEQTAQIWNSIVVILEQINEILGKEKLTIKEFIQVMRDGIKSIEIGIIPPAVDGLIMGNMQRSRRGNIKVTVIIGANEGILPLENTKAQIIKDEEKKYLEARNINICKLSTLIKSEETLAIYKNISKTKEKLYMSYCASDDEGKSLEPSIIFNKIYEMFNNIEIEKDIFSLDKPQRLIGGVDITRNNLIEALRQFKNEGIINEIWIQVYKWFLEKESIDILAENIVSEFTQPMIKQEYAQDIYNFDDSNELKLSPSRLEMFGKCPFAHFVKYGLKPEEVREYQIGAAEQGSIFHQCIMEASKELSKNCKNEKCEITDKNSLWMTVTRDEVSLIVDNILQRISKEYKEGILSQGEYERYRAERIKNVCVDSTWMAINHVRAGNIVDMDFEVAFGKGKKLPPIKFENANIKAMIEGQIDRIDILQNDFVKIIDYKSGSEKFSKEEAKAGIKLQLFLYLIATINAGHNGGGAFYFHLDEKHGKNDEITKNMEASFKMDGFLLNDERVVEAIDNRDTRSKIYIGGQDRKLEKEEFDQLIKQVNECVENLAKNITKGEIGIFPKKVNNNISCTYCQYKGICKFDLSIEGCDYTMI